jgi:hypothetical protein
MTSEANKKIWKSTWHWIKYLMLPMTAVYYAYGELLFEFFYNQPYFLLVMLAAVFNAAMDSTEVLSKFDKSIFGKLNRNFFCKEISLDKAIKIGSYKADFWHLCKSSMIVSLCAAIVFYEPYIKWIDFLFAGYLWNITFSLFYDIIFKRK